MNTSENIKVKIHNQIDSLDEKVLEEFYGVMKNFINSKSDLNAWDSLSTAQKNGIHEAIKQIDKGEGISHTNVMSNIRQKFTDA